MVAIKTHHAPPYRGHGFVVYPALLLDKLTDALNKAMDDGNARRRLLDLGSEIPDKARRGQERLAALVKGEIVRWGPIIKAAVIKAE
jgi:tripartite-type tricarboxylate transporter receptor subunit TctC